MEPDAAETILGLEFDENDTDDVEVDEENLLLSLNEEDGMFASPTRSETSSTGHNVPAGSPPKARLIRGESLTDFLSQEQDVPSPASSDAQARPHSQPMSENASDSAVDAEDDGDAEDAGAEADEGDEEDLLHEDAQSLHAADLSDVDFDEEIGDDGTLSVARQEPASQLRSIDEREPEGGEGTVFDDEDGDDGGPVGATSEVLDLAEEDDGVGEAEVGEESEGEGEDAIFDDAEGVTGVLANGDAAHDDVHGDFDGHEDVEEEEDVEMADSSAASGKSGPNNPEQVHCVCITLAENGESFYCFGAPSRMAGGDGEESEGESAGGVYDREELVVFQERTELYRSPLAAFMLALQEELSMSNDVVLYFSGLELKFYTNLPFAEKLSLYDLVFLHSKIQPSAGAYLSAELTEEPTNFLARYNELVALSQAPDAPDDGEGRVLGKRSIASEEDENTTANGEPSTKRRRP
mmetsp:Transcript_14742/g.57824  ORF Transcript_14742/g.57824 Transcript_14742/m.57824 type:complete len:466 (-) Transcript_14742:261-1658(-)